MTFSTFQWDLLGYYHIYSSVIHSQLIIKQALNGLSTVSLPLLLFLSYLRNGYILCTEFGFLPVTTSKAIPSTSKLGVTVLIVWHILVGVLGRILHGRTIQDRLFQDICICGLCGHARWVWELLEIGYAPHYRGIDTKWSKFIILIEFRSSSKWYLIDTLGLFFWITTFNFIAYLPPLVWETFLPWIATREVHSIYSFYSNGSISEPISKYTTNKQANTAVTWHSSFLTFY